MSKINSLSGYEAIPALAKGFPIKVRRYVNSASLTPHWHEHLELIYFLRGSCRAIVGGRASEVGAGDVIIVNGTEVHSFTVTSGEAEYLCVLIYPDFFRDLDFSGIMIENVIRADTAVGALISDMYREYERGGLSSDMMQKSLAYSLMATLVSEHSAAPLTDRDRDLHKAALTRLDKVLDAVAERYSTHISTADLAELCYISEAHFCRFFKAATGKTALEYINGYRAERAEALLKNTDMSLSEVAEAVGFEDVNYFCRVFKRARGVSPGEFRRAER